MNTAQRIPILMYHRVDDAHNQWERKYCISPKCFAEHMSALAQSNWQAVSVDDFMAWRQGKKTLPEKAFLISFDDGFKGVYEHAWPILRQYQWPAVMFLVSNLIGQDDAWSKNENPEGRTYPLLNQNEIAEMEQGGFSFHGHSRNHKDLTALNDIELVNETAGCKAELELLGISCRYFAYPYGRFSEREATAVKMAGFEAAFSVQPGFNRSDVDLFRIRRLDIFGTDTSAMLLRKITLGSNDGRLIAWAGYYLNQLKLRLGLG
ncbi:polysaccharide deacetylase family protein [Candidatus Nitrotoga sp. M5]|uniref:polysaccharide deacetylase family protein n=1 Tax=Candidatus Nitrotoga sp. M5 TaxID=2890409 RepID=UPI001EF23813|nr:polysaccharide deacetylase family protein [Candidatus Nitrotoga sp. M5]CAH1386239.1 Peptidoglycan/xylan/chitin deacetylase, PgdA/CDA1 family [Candidatus Nitrotoga sp. M5]